MTARSLRRWRQPSPFGTVTVVVSERGVRAIGLPEDDVDDGAATTAPDDAIAGALDGWLRGRTTVCDVPVDLDGVEGFRRDVLETLRREVGWGQTVSYGDLAARAGRPRAARAVGAAMASNPLPFVIPCHRVLAAGGRIGGYGGGRNAIELKRELLAREGTYPR